MGMGVTLLSFWYGKGRPCSSGRSCLSPLPGCTPDIVAAGRDPLFWKRQAPPRCGWPAAFSRQLPPAAPQRVLTARFSLARALLAPVLHIVRAAPVASFIILALVWFRTDVLPLFIAFLMVVPVVWANVEKGIRAADPALLEMARVYRFGRLKTLLRVQLPSVMPYFLAACTTGLGFAWKSGIAAEVICRPGPLYRKAIAGREDLSGNTGGFRLDRHCRGAEHPAGKGAAPPGKTARPALQCRCMRRDGMALALTHVDFAYGSLPILEDVSPGLPGSGCGLPVRAVRMRQDHPAASALRPGTAAAWADRRPRGPKKPPPSSRKTACYPG